MPDFSAAGLSETEIKVYTALVKHQDVKPAELAELVGETRTNMYKILDKLTKLKLATKFDKNKTLHYRAENPSRLMQLIREIRDKHKRSEQELEVLSEVLLKDYIKNNEQPGVTFYQGKAEIAKIFRDIANSKTDVVFTHTMKGIDFYGFETMHKLRMLAPTAGVKRRTITPDDINATSDYRESDPRVLLTRTWVDKNEYAAPVEWGVFNDKLYIISYGQEALGLVIESQQIASAFKEVFELIEKSQKYRPSYKKLPKLASVPARKF